MLKAAEVITDDERPLDHVDEQGDRPLRGQGVDADVIVLPGGIEPLEAALDILAGHDVAGPDAEIRQHHGGSLAGVPGNADRVDADSGCLGWCLG